MNNLYTYKIKEWLKIYDGDTVTVIIDCGFGIYLKQRIRLFGINAPEIRGSERPEGLKSKQRLIELVQEYKDDIYVKTIKDKTGKYGRLLGILLIKDKKDSINKILLDEGFAVSFMDKKKLI